MAPATVREIPDFPFDTFEAFAEACRNGRALVWVRYDFRSVWRHSTPSARLWQLLLTGSPLLASLLFFGLALTTRDWWLLCAIPAALLGSLAASPAPGLLAGGGCVALALLAAGAAGSALLDRSLVWAGVAGYACWFLTSAGKGVADPTIREAMVSSEQVLVRLVERRAITKVVETAATTGQPI